MAVKWHKTSYPGIRYREHSTRKNGVRKDRYFSIYYRLNGKNKEEGLGWSSQGWSVATSAEQLTELKQNHRTGSGHQTLAEKRELEQRERDDRKLAEELLSKESLTFGYIFSELYYPHSELSKSQRSRLHEESMFRIWLKPTIGHLPLNRITPLDLEKIKKRMLAAGKAVRTVKYTIAVVRQVFNYASMAEIYQGIPPTKNIKIPLGDNRRLRFLTHEEADMLLDELLKRSMQLYELALVSLRTGARAGEIFSLKWGDVDFERNQLTLWDTKNLKTRIVFMTGDIKEMLFHKERGSYNDLVFPDRRGNRIESISKSFFRAVDAVGLNEGITDRRMKVVFHSLRHTFASWLVENGENIYTVKELMGHSTLIMTERYAHLGNGTLHNAIKRMEQSIPLVDLCDRLR